jgi:preprotein translocase subunit YajC
VTTYALIAQEVGPVTKSDEQPGSPYSIFILMGAIFVVFYLLLIRPQQKKERDKQKQRQEMLKNLTRNDHVATIGGMHGIVASVTDTEVVLKVDEKNDVRIRFAREAISRVVTDEGEEGDRKLSEKPEENR